MANLIYNSYKADQMNGAIDLDTDTIKVMLVTSTYAPLATHAKRSDVTNEVAGTGYTAGGEIIASSVVSVVAGKGRWDAIDTTWATSTITARGAVLYKSRGGAATADELIGYLDFTTDRISSNGDFTIQWSATGILELA
jgi:hypothetical protein